MKLKCCENEDDTLEVWSNQPDVDNSVYVSIKEVDIDPFTDCNQHAALALSPDNAIKLAKELIRLAEGG